MRHGCAAHDVGTARHMCTGALSRGVYARPRVSPRAAFEGESPIPLSTRSVAVDNTIFPNSTQHNKPSRVSARSRRRAGRPFLDRFDTFQAAARAVTRVRTTRRRRTRRRRPVSVARPARGKTGVARPRCGVHASPCRSGPRLCRASAAARLPRGRRRWACGPRLRAPSRAPPALARPRPPRRRPVRRGRPRAAG